MLKRALTAEVGRPADQLPRVPQSPPAVLVQVVSARAGRASDVVAAIATVAARRLFMNDAFDARDSLVFLLQPMLPSK